MEQLVTLISVDELILDGEDTLGQLWSDYLVLGFLVKLKRCSSWPIDYDFGNRWDCIWQL